MPRPTGRRLMIAGACALGLLLSATAQAAADPVSAARGFSLLPADAAPLRLAFNDDFDPFLQPVEPDPETDRDWARMERRHRMLRWHQGFALTSLGLLTAQNIIGQILYSRLQSVGGGPTADLQQMHRMLAYATFGTYAVAAPLAIFAPAGQVEGSGIDAVDIHRGLALVHGTGMAIMPWFGMYVAGERQRGADFERIERLRKGHLAAGHITWAALAGAALVIVID